MIMMMMMMMLGFATTLLKCDHKRQLPYKSTSNRNFRVQLMGIVSQQLALLYTQVSASQLQSYSVRGQP